jgi:hypothetical protein
LGHIVSEKGVYVDFRKVSAVVNFPSPSDINELRSILELTTFYKRFIKDYSHKAWFMHQLFKKDVVFYWSFDCQIVLNYLKTELSTAYPDITLPFIIEVNYSSKGIGDILSQNGPNGVNRVIAYYEIACIYPAFRLCLLPLYVIL